MTISERIFTTMKTKKISQVELAKNLEVTTQLVNSWKQRNTSPPVEYIPTICELLNTTWEYIVTGKESDESLSNAEQRLLAYYRASNANGRGKIVEYASDIATLHPAEQREETQKLG